MKTLKVNVIIDVLGIGGLSGKQAQIRLSFELYNFQLKEMRKQLSSSAYSFISLKPRLTPKYSFSGTRTKTILNGREH